MPYVASWCSLILNGASAPHCALFTLDACLLAQWWRCLTLNEMLPNLPAATHFLAAPTSRIPPWSAKCGDFIPESVGGGLQSGLHSSGMAQTDEGQRKKAQGGRSQDFIQRSTNLSGTRATWCSENTGKIKPEQRHQSCTRG